MDGAAAGSHGYNLCSHGRVAAERAIHKCFTYLCSLSYKATENCRERILPGESNGSLGAPLFFGQQLSIKPLESEAWEWRSLESWGQTLDGLIQRH